MGGCEMSTAIISAQSRQTSGVCNGNLTRKIIVRGTLAAVLAHLVMQISFFAAAFAMHGLLSRLGYVEGLSACARQLGMGYLAVSVPVLLYVATKKQLSVLLMVVGILGLVLGVLVGAVIG